jgi:UDPglucose 6-dehydrogenase
MTPMEIAIVGAGYVGAVTGAGLAGLGHRVSFVDLDEAVVDLLQQGVVGFHEPGLERLLADNRARISAGTDLAAAVATSDLTFLCVGTPSAPGGECDLGAVRAASRSIGAALAGTDRAHTLVVKSTVPPGTTAGVVRPAVEECAGRGPAEGLRVVVNPEFLREGYAVRDFFSPTRIVIGTDDPSGSEALDRLYVPFSCPIVRCGYSTAEMVKYSSNAMLAVRISSANEIGGLCKALDIDAGEVMRTVGLDERIGPLFLNTGLGFGGSCLPKDVRALVALGRSLGREPSLLSAVLAVNEAQADALLDLVEKRVGCAGRRIGVLGLAFKPGTDDVRESRAVPVIRGLLERGATVVAYDPMAMDRFRPLFPAIEYAATPGEVLASVDTVVIATEWPEFEDLDYGGLAVIDGRRCERARETARLYEGLCW